MWEISSKINHTRDSEEQGCQQRQLQQRFCSHPAAGKGCPCRVRLGGVLGIPDLRPGFLPCSLGGICTPSCVLISQQKPIYAKGFLGGASGKESACQCRRGRRLRFHPQVGKIPWRRKWQPAPVFLPGESHGHRSLAGYSPWGHKESDTTELSD